MTVPRGNPAPRPALRRAPDADVHPAAPKHGPEAAGGVAPVTAPDGAPAVPPAVDTPAEPDVTVGPVEQVEPAATIEPVEPAATTAARPAAAAPPVPPARAAAPPPRTRAGVTPQPLPLTGGGLRRARGRTTSDALRGKGGDKLVDLGVRVPKSLRKQLRQAADARGMSPDELVALLLRNHLGRR